jgi:hypothetical protein
MTKECDLELLNRPSMLEKSMTDTKRACFAAVRLSSHDTVLDSAVSAP